MKTYLYILTTFLISYCFAAPVNPQSCLAENEVELSLPTFPIDDDAILSWLEKLKNSPLNIKHVLWVRNVVMPRLKQHFEFEYEDDFQTLHPAHSKLMEALEKLLLKPEVQRLMEIIRKPITNVDRDTYEKAKRLTTIRFQLIIHRRLIALRKYVLSPERDSGNGNPADEGAYQFSLTPEIIIYIHEANEAQLLLKLFASNTSPLEQLYKEWEILQQKLFPTIEEIMAFIKRAAILLRFRNLQTKFPSHEVELNDKLKPNPNNLIKEQSASWPDENDNTPYKDTLPHVQTGSNFKRKANPNVFNTNPVELGESSKRQKLTDDDDSKNIDAASKHKEIFANLMLFHNLMEDSWLVENDNYPYKDTKLYAKAASNEKYKGNPALSNPTSEEFVRRSSRRKPTHNVVSNKIDAASKLKKSLENLISLNNLIKKQSATWSDDEGIKPYLEAIDHAMNLHLSLIKSYSFVQMHFDRYVEASLAMASFNIYQVMKPYIEFLKPYEFFETTLQSYESVFQTMKEIGQILENRGTINISGDVKFFHYDAWFRIQHKYMKMICKTQKDFFKLERKPSFDSLMNFIQCNWKNVVRMEIFSRLMIQHNPRGVFSARISKKFEDLKDYGIQNMKNFCMDIGMDMYIDLPGFPDDVSEGYVEFFGNSELGLVAENDGLNFSTSELEKEFGVIRVISENGPNMMSIDQHIDSTIPVSEMRDYFGAIISA